MLNIYLRIYREYKINKPRVDKHRNGWTKANTSLYVMTFYKICSACPMNSTELFAKLSNRSNIYTKFFNMHHKWKVSTIVLTLNMHSSQQ